MRLKTGQICRTRGDGEIVAVWGESYMEGKHHILVYAPDYGYIWTLDKELIPVPVEEYPILIGIDPVIDEAIARTFKRMRRKEAA